MARGNRVITEELAMRPLATSWSELRAWSATHGAELRLCVRSTTAAVLTLAAAQLLHLPIALWAVLTAVILTQINVGRSLKASTDYLLSTLGGAVYAGAIGALVPHDNALAVFAGLAIAVAPAVLLAALYPRFGAAPFTAVMVFFGPTITHHGPDRRSLRAGDRGRGRMRRRPPRLAFRLAGACAGSRHRSGDGDAFAHRAISAGAVRRIYAKSGSAGAVEYPEQNR
ncbi:MAG TPA: FUSC family protein [Xanthobacteraceae bacterium]|nr:FUSC family protein [Xanthobacteraceae bacterium]